MPESTEKLASTIPWSGPLTLATALAAGCGHGAAAEDFQPARALGVEVATSDPAGADVVAEAPLLGQPLGTFQLTYYSVAAEADAVAPRDPDLSSDKPDSLTSALTAAPPSESPDAASATETTTTDEDALATGAGARTAPAIEVAPAAANDNAAPRPRSASDVVALYHRKSCDRPLA